MIVLLVATRLCSGQECAEILSIILENGFES
jgi:hypothetical protein